MAKRTETAKPPPKAVEQLVAFFHHRGYVRSQNAGRVEREGSSKYKKGYEIRLIAESAAELTTIQALLGAAGFVAGRPFRKHSKYCQPIYGRTQVKAFLALVAGRSLPVRDGDRSRRSAASVARARAERDVERKR